MLEHGDGVPQDKAQALQWYQKAAKQGDKKAQQKAEKDKNKADEILKQLNVDTGEDQLKGLIDN